MRPATADAADRGLCFGLTGSSPAPAEPVFVQIQQIPDSAEKNDDKLYFFFREKSLDSSGGASPSILARVGRVCLVSRTH